MDGEGSKKSVAREALASFCAYNGTLKGASANNENAENWVKKQLNIWVDFLYSGSTKEEFRQWKVHVSTWKRERDYGMPSLIEDGWKPNLLRLSKEAEERIKYDIGCFPIFL